MLTLEEGARLVAIARNTLDSYLRSDRAERPSVSGDLMEPRGVFCTLNTYPDDELRGCTGLPYPDKPLAEAVVAAATSTARDPRFPPLQLEELPHITIEVSVLTKPELIEVQHPEEYLSFLEPGKDGLILQHGLHTGLFLPQVWETIPDSKEFLGALCYKAWLADSNAWRDKETKLFRFRAQVFREKRPGGDVEEET